MNIKQAREIVGKMISWSMMAQGIELPKKPEKITETLTELIKANKMVEKANKRSHDRIDKIIKEKGSWNGKRSVQTTIADRGIAALYVAANFHGDRPATADVLGMHGRNIVVCLDKNFLQEED